MKSQQEIIIDYFQAYNEFNVDKMIENFDINILFENKSNGIVNFKTTGLIPFAAQAKKASLILGEREAKITKIKKVNKNQIKVSVLYKGTLKTKFNGIPAGEVIETEGQTIFTFKNDKVIQLQDLH